MDMVPDTWHVSVTCPSRVDTWFCNFWSLWATDKCEGSKWGRISPAIQWWWSQTRDTCPSRVDTWLTRFFITSEPFELQTSVRGQNGEKFHWESNGNGVRHMAHVHYVSDACFLFGMVQCSMFLKQVRLIFHEWTWFWLHYIDMCNEQNDDNVIIFQHDWICFNLTQFFMILIMMVMSTSSSILWKFLRCRSQDCLNLKKQLLLPDFQHFSHLQLMPGLIPLSFFLRIF